MRKGKNLKCLIYIIFRRNFLDKKRNNVLLLAKEEQSKGNKTKALLNLKKKKMFDKEIDKLDGSIITIEQNILNIESASVTGDIFDALKLSKNIMEKLNKNINIEEMEEVLYETRELQVENDEIGMILAQSTEDVVGDEELEKEFREMFEEKEEEKLIGATVKLKKEMTKSEKDLLELSEMKVPTGEIKNKKEKTEEEELDDMQAMLGL